MLTTPLSILPFDGIVLYYPSFIAEGKSILFFQEILKNTNWQQGEITLFGKKVKEPRLKAFFNKTNSSYTYSGETQKNNSFSPSIQHILNQLETIQPGFNSCLANLYRDGADYMGYHADNEPEVKRNPCIASLSFGTTRKMSFKHINGKRIDLELKSGDLVLMKDWAVQQHWKHTIPKSKKVKTARINLTYRTL